MQMKYKHYLVFRFWTFDKEWDIRSFVYFAENEKLTDSDIIQAKHDFYNINIGRYKIDDDGTGENIICIFFSLLDY